MWITGLKRMLLMNGKRMPFLPFSRLKHSNRELTDYPCRPISENANWEAAANPDQPFDYDAEPNNFYIDVESIGNLEPDAIIQQGIIVLQRKLATTISALSGEGDGAGPEDAGMMDAGEDAYEPPEGIDGSMTAYGNGAAGAWGASAQTPYGATPYGQSAYGF